MTSMDSTQQTADVSEAQIAAALAEAESKPPITSQTPGEWIKANLFNSALNSAITVILTPIFLYLAYRFFRFVFITGRWEPVETNLTLFMVGQYPRDELWRTQWQLVLLGLAVGLIIGLVRSRNRDIAEETGVEQPKTSWKTYLSNYWSIALFVLVCLIMFANTTGPWLLMLATVVVAVVGVFVTSQFHAGLRPLGWTLAGLVGVASFQVMSGTGGWAWFFTTLAFVPLVSNLIGRLPVTAAWPFAGVAALVGAGVLATQGGVVGIAALLVGLYALFNVYQGDRIDGMRVGAVVIVGTLAYLVSQAIGLEGIDWQEWGGLHLNLIVSAAAIVLAFPLGIMLAMGRRSTLPAVKYMSVAYIEFFRGAPLITFLLAAQFFLGFFLDTDTPLSLITRAIAAITLFSGAYIAEIIRGGLQAVDKGQTEAGQALGLSAAKNMRLIVLPQALRAVIPAMVGQFISLFKDTTLLFILGIPEFLRVRSLVHAQEAFRGFGIAETLVFVAFGFWAVAFSMSRESQRLERRLGVGTR